MNPLNHAVTVPAAAGPLGLGTGTPRVARRSDSGAALRMIVLGVGHYGTAAVQMRLAEGVGRLFPLGRYRRPRSALPKSETTASPRCFTNAEASCPGTPKTKGSPTAATLREISRRAAELCNAL